MNEKLLDAAHGVLKNAYSPYSKIKVAAAVEGVSGEIYTGVNVENASFSLTNCAERNALFAGVTNGEKEFKEMVIVTDSSLVKSPCGACRQVISEFSKNLVIHFYGPEGFIATYHSKELLPAGFNLEEGHE